MEGVDKILVWFPHCPSEEIRTAVINVMQSSHRLTVARPAQYCKTWLASPVRQQAPSGGIRSRIEDQRTHGYRHASATLDASPQNDPSKAEGGALQSAPGWSPRSSARPETSKAATAEMNLRRRSATMPARRRSSPRSATASISAASRSIPSPAWPMSTWTPTDSTRRRRCGTRWRLSLQVSGRCRVSMSRIRRRG